MGHRSGMQKLKRITTEYIATEDRLRLTAETEDDGVCVLWLTRRVLARLLVPVFSWLGRQEGTLPRADAMQHFAQEAATASVKPQQPVCAADKASAWLINSIDFSADDETLYLVFRGAEQNAAKISLAVHPLRQWLSILRKQCQKGEWVLDVWPSWMPEPDSNANTSRMRPH
jgi:hypothetical protein